MRKKSNPAAVHKKWHKFTDRWVFKQDTKRKIAARIRREKEDAKNKDRIEAEEAKRRRQRILAHEYHEMRLLCMFLGGD